MIQNNAFHVSKQCVLFQIFKYLNLNFGFLKTMNLNFGFSKTLNLNFRNFLSFSIHNFKYPACFVLPPELGRAN